MEHLQVTLLQKITKLILNIRKTIDSLLDQIDLMILMEFLLKILVNLFLKENILARQRNEEHLQTLFFDLNIQKMVLGALPELVYGKCMHHLIVNLFMKQKILILEALGLWQLIILIIKLFEQYKLMLIIQEILQLQKIIQICHIMDDVSRL